MALRTVRLDGDPILRKKAKKVKRVDGAILSLLRDMADTMYNSNGIGLAGNQVGVLHRVITADDGDGLLMLVNPVIVEKEGSECKEEGCLSLPEFYGDVERATYIKVRALDEKGNKIEIDAYDLLARILQHEIDHLDGKLFTDTASNVSKREQSEDFDSKSTEDSDVEPTEAIAEVEVMGDVE